MPKYSVDARNRISLIALLVFFIVVLLLVKDFTLGVPLLMMLTNVCLFLFIAYLSIAVIHSIYKEDQYRREVIRMTEQMKAMEVRRDEFISMAAHELRAPLTAVRGFLSMVIGGDTGKVNTKTKEFLEDAEISSRRMIRLVNNMVNVNRIEEGSMSYLPELFHLSDLMKEVRAEFEVEAVRKGLMLRVHNPVRVHDMVFADKMKIADVMVNFVSNAIKYTEEGMVEMRVVNRAPHIIRFEVTDTGPGITKLEQEKLFHKFYRLQAKVGKTIGTGLGLYMSKLIIREFRGAIGLTSEEKKGSTFWFELPTQAHKK